MSSKDAKNARARRNYRGRSMGTGVAQQSNAARESLLVPIDPSVLGDDVDDGARGVEGNPSTSGVDAPSVQDDGKGGAVTPNGVTEGATASNEGPASSTVGADQRSARPGDDAPSSPTANTLAASARTYSRNSGAYSARKHARFSTRQRMVLIIVAVIAVIVAALAGVGYAYYQSLQSKIAVSEDVEESLTATVNSEPYYVLVLGSDKRPKEGDADSRSDVMMLVRVDEPNKLVTLVSFPRDTMVELGNYGTQKINAAFQLGGASLAISTVEDYANVKISHYVEVYFDGFADLVDDLGGVDVDVPEYVSYGGVTLEPGEQHLNGKQALVFARNRKTYATGDFRRTECQRILVQALAEKVLSKNATELPGVIESLTDCFSTDMSLDSLASLAINMQGMTKDSMYSAMVPSTAGYLGDVSYTFTYINRWKLMMERVRAGEDPTLDKKELAICGDVCTRDAELDMTEDIPSDIRAQLDAHAKKKAKKAAKKAAQNGEESSSSESASSGDTEASGYVAKNGEIVQE